MQVNILNPDYEEKYINEMKLKIDEVIGKFMLEVKQR